MKQTGSLTFMFIHFSRFIHNGLQIRIISGVINSMGKLKQQQQKTFNLIEKHAEMHLR